MITSKPFRIVSLSDRSFMVSYPSAYGNLGFSAQTSGLSIYRETTVAVAAARKFGESLNAGLRLSVHQIDNKKLWGSDSSFPVRLFVLSPSETVSWSLWDSISTGLVWVSHKNRSHRFSPPVTSTHRQGHLRHLSKLRKISLTGRDKSLVSSGKLHHGFHLLQVMLTIRTRQVLAFHCSFHESPSTMQSLHISIFLKRTLWLFIFASLELTSTEAQTLEDILSTLVVDEEENILSMEELEILESLVRQPVNLNNAGKRRLEMIPLFALADIQLILAERRKKGSFSMLTKLPKSPAYHSLRNSYFPLFPRWNEWNLFQWLLEQVGHFQ